jgi:hypothetical protein
MTGSLMQTDLFDPRTVLVEAHILQGHQKFRQSTKQEIMKDLI